MHAVSFVGLLPSEICFLCIRVPTKPAIFFHASPNHDRDSIYICIWKKILEIMVGSVESLFIAELFSRNACLRQQ